MTNRLRAFLNLERGEGWPTFLLFSYLTLGLTAYTLARAVRDALFLDRFSAFALPYVYVALAVVTGVVVFIYVRLSSRLNQTSLISGTLVFFAGNVLLLWWAVSHRWSSIAVVFYIWTSIFGIIVTTQIWTIANSVLDLRQAKRLFSVVSSGGILGSMLGGGAAAVLVKQIGTEHLVLVLIAPLGLSVVLVQVLMRRYAQAARRGGATPGREEGKKGTETVVKAIAGRRYLRLIAALLGLSAIVTLLVDFQFKVVVQGAIASKDQLTSFFGSFYAYLGAFSFLLQLGAGSRVVERYGVRTTLLALPLTLISGTMVLLAFPMRLWAGSLLKGSDAALRYSVDKSAVELLYLPVPASLRAEVKAVIDMVLQRLADGVGGALLLLMTRVFGLGLSGVGGMNLVLIAFWVWVALQARKEYVAAIRANLSERPALPRSTLRMVFGDHGSIATLHTMLKSKDDEVVLYAIDLALSLRRKDWVPAALTSHPSPRVRLKAMEVVPMTEPEILERVRTDSNSTVRAVAVARFSDMERARGSESALTQLLQARDLKVRLAALSYLAETGGERESAAVRSHLARIPEELEKSPEQGEEVAEALGDFRHPAAMELHLCLLQHADRAVKKAAILSAGRAGHRELVPHLVRLLADQKFSSEARRALQEYGPRILGTLADVLRDPTEDLEVRRSIPLVLAYMPDQAAVDLLVESLFDYDGLMRYRAIRALGKLRLIDPDLRFNAENLALRIREESENTRWYREALTSLYPAGESDDLLAQLLKDKVTRGSERVFRLLALLLPPASAVASFLALVEHDRMRKASAAEYLDNVLPGKLKQSVLPLIEPRESPWKPKRDVKVILHACLRGTDQILRECAADAIAKHRWPEFSPLDRSAPRMQEG